MYKCISKSLRKFKFIPQQVYAYAQGMYTLVSDAAKTRRSASAAAFRTAVAAAAATAAGAR